MTPTVTALQLRRRIVEASKQRRRPSVLPAAMPPAGVVTAYTSELVALSRELDRAFAEELSRHGIPVRADAQGEAPAPAKIRGRLEAIAARIVGRRSLLITVATIAGRTSAWSRQQWSRQVKAALGVDLSGDLDLAKLTDGFRRENVRLIKSLAADKVARVHRVLTAAGTGTRVEDIAARIRDATAATESRAALIARDQVLSLNSQVTQARHQAAGVQEYVWRTSRDERVRPAHRALDGTRHAYREPPVVDPRTGRREHPGQDFQCRCTAEPVIPGLDG